MARDQRIAGSLLAIGAALYMQAAVAAPAAVPTEPTTIEIWWHEYGPFTAYVKQLIAEYQKLHPNVTINATVTSSADIRCSAARLLTRLTAAGNPINVPTIGSARCGSWTRAEGAQRSAASAKKDQRADHGGDDNAVTI